MIAINKETSMETVEEVPVTSEVERYALLKAAVRDRPAHYEAHLALVGYLRHHRPGSLDLLKAREDPELWEEWIQDRKGVGGEDAHEQVLALYRHAFEDYQCAKLWPGYLETLEESLDEDDGAGVNTMREAFEEALGRVGVHPILGGAVWRAYLRFEKDELEDAEETGGDDVEISKALERVKRLYRRQLSVPLVGNDEVLAEMGEAFEGDEDGLKEVCRLHAKAADMLAVRMEHEQAVAKCQEKDPGGASTASAWEVCAEFLLTPLPLTGAGLCTKYLEESAYAAMEAADGQPSRAVLVLERAESEGCCLHERIWLMRSDLLLGGLSAKGPEATLTARAVRNLPWSSELWCRRLRSLERSYEEGSAEESSESADGGAKAAGAATKAVRTAWRDALACALPSPDDYVKVLLSYCAFARRRLAASAKDAAKSKAVSDCNNSSGRTIGPAPPPTSKGTAKFGQDVGARASLGEAVTAALEGVRGAFDEAEAFVEKNYPGWDEGWLTVVRQRIQMEEFSVEETAELGLDGVDAESQARRQRERALRHSGKRLAAWLEAVSWERRASGDLAACRRLFVRAMKEVQDYPEAAYSAFLDFEQEVGSLEEWDAANKEVFKSRAVRGLLSKDLPLASRSWGGGVAALPLHQPSRRQQQQQRNVKKESHPGGKPSSSTTSGGDHRRDRDQHGHQQAHRHRERGAARTTAGASTKRGRPANDDGDEVGDETQKRQRITPAPATSVPTGSSQGGGMQKVGVGDGGLVGIAEKENAPAASAAAATGGTAAAGESVKQSEDDDQKKKKKKKKKKNKEREEEGGVRWPAHPTTVFVRGLGSGATSAGLRAAFEGAGVGSVVEARVVEDRKTHEAKDYGLVQFDEPEAVEKALALDGTQLVGGRVKITRSRHPAVVPAAPVSEAENASSGSGSGIKSGDAGGGGSSMSGGNAPDDKKRAGDWECVNPECGNLCFSFRKRCNRCGTGRDGTPAPQPLATKGLGGKGGGGEAPSSHRPRLQLGSSIRPRALRNDRASNGDASSETSESKTEAAGSMPKKAGGEGAGGKEDGEMPPPSGKSNTDFRAMLNNR